jgi:putative transposase
VGTLRREILDRLLIYNEAHYNRHRPHQSRQQQPPDSDQPPTPATATDLQTHKIQQQSVLGGLINKYHHAA